MRALLAALAVAALAVPAAPAAAQAPAPVDGTWLVDFTAASVRTVGDDVGREGGLDCDTASCGASYQFPDGVGGTASLVLTFDASGCPAAPCELRAVSAAGRGFNGTVAWDGTTYRATGKWFYATAHQCEQYLPDGTDTMTFTVSGPPDNPALTGELTGLFGYVGPTDEQGDCTDVTGYELYTGPVTGRPTPDALARLRDRARAGGGAGAAVAPGASSRAAAVRRADALAADAHTRPVLSTRVATARDVPWGPSALAVSALLALLLVVLMPFPAALFNATLEENYDEVRGWLRLRPREPAGPVAPLPQRSPWPRFLLLVGGVSVLGAFLDPGLGLDSASLVLVAGLALAAVALSLLGALPGRLYVRRRYAEGTHLALYPLGLAVAAFCVLVSRLTSFEPGYLYGVVAGFGFARQLRDDEKGRISVATSAALLVLAGAAFALRLPVHDAVVDGGGWPLTLLDTVLAALFAAGVEANVLGLLPLRFLPGETLYRWRRPVWGVVFGLNVFAFVHTLSAAAGGASTGASVTAAAVLFGVFATVSVTFWAYFRFRRPAAPLPVGTD